MYKDYEKLNQVEEHQYYSSKTHHKPIPKTPRKPSKTTIAIIFSIPISLLLGSFICATFILHYKILHRPSEFELGLDSSASFPIRLVCSVTRHPDSCLSTISSAINLNSEPDPISLFYLTLRAAIDDLSKLASFTESLSQRVNDVDPVTQSALGDCRSSLAAAHEKVNQSGVASLEDATVVSDLDTWIRAAMADQDTCLEGLEVVGRSTAVSEVREKVHDSKVYLSNSLAILGNMKSIMKKFHDYYNRPSTGKPLSLGKLTCQCRHDHN